MKYLSPVFMILGASFLLAFFNPGVLPQSLLDLNMVAFSDDFVGIPVIPAMGVVCGLVGFCLADMPESYRPFSDPHLSGGHKHTRY